MRIGVLWFVLIASVVLSGCLDTIEEIHVLRDGRFLFREIVTASRSEAVEDINKRNHTEGVIPSDSELFAHERRLHAWSEFTPEIIPDIGYFQIRDSLTDSLVFVISEAVASNDRAVEALHDMLFGVMPGQIDSVKPRNELVFLNVRTKEHRTTFDYTYGIMKDSVVDTSHPHSEVDTMLDAFLATKDKGVVRIFGSDPQITGPATNARIVDGCIEWRLPTVELMKFWRRKSKGATFEVGPSSNER